MKPTLFLSDLHLSPERPAAAAAFHAFARGPAREAAAVYILGDLFDAWIGDDQLREPFARGDRRRRCAASTDAGVPLFVARGNRDFLLGERFARADRRDAPARAARRRRRRRRRRSSAARRRAVHRRRRLPALSRAHRATRDASAGCCALPYRCAGAASRGWLRRKQPRGHGAEAGSDHGRRRRARSPPRSARTDVARMIHGHTHRPARHRARSSTARRASASCSPTGTIAATIWSSTRGCRTRRRRVETMRARHAADHRRAAPTRR